MGRAGNCGSIRSDQTVVVLGGSRMRDRLCIASAVGRPRALRSYSRVAGLATDSRARVSMSSSDPTACRRVGSGSRLGGRPARGGRGRPAGSAAGRPGAGGGRGFRRPCSRERRALARFRTRGTSPSTRSGPVGLSLLIVNRIFSGYRRPPSRDTVESRALLNVHVVGAAHGASSNGCHSTKHDARHATE